MLLVLDPKTWIPNEYRSRNFLEEEIFTQLRLAGAWTWRFDGKMQAVQWLLPTAKASEVSNALWHISESYMDSPLSWRFQPVNLASFRMEIQEIITKRSIHLSLNRVIPFHSTERFHHPVKRKTYRYESIDDDGPVHPPTGWPTRMEFFEAICRTRLTMMEECIERGLGLPTTTVLVQDYD